MRRNNLAVHHLAGQDALTATRESATILTEYPGYALGHITKAAIALIIQEPQVAREALQSAERLEPGLEIVPQLWAQLLASENKLEEALVSVQEGVRRRPNDPQPLFILARIERRLKRDTELRQHARQILALTPQPERERRAELLRAALGDTALDDAGEAWLPK